ANSRSIIILGGLVILLLGAALAGYRLRHAAPNPPEAGENASQSAPAPAAEPDELSAAVVKRETQTPPAREKAFIVPNRPVAAPASAPANPTPAPVSLPAESLYSQQLLQKFVQLDPNQGKITPEQAAAITQNFKDLASQGKAAIPAIRQF